VNDKAQATSDMHYNISQPVDLVFNAIKNLVELADHANSPLTPQQI
jgi:hypothetical protein